MNALLDERHYLGSTHRGRLRIGGYDDMGRLVACMVWSSPTARHVPAGAFELSRWCLTPDAGENAGSRMHAAAVRMIRHELPDVSVLVSYSDPSAGHDGALYRACNWLWAPTWHRLRPPPSGLGSWDGGSTRQNVKDRWVFVLRRSAPVDAFHVGDVAAVRRYLRSDEYTAVTHRWRTLHPLIDEASP